MDVLPFADGIRTGTGGGIILVALATQGSHDIGCGDGGTQIATIDSFAQQHDI